MKNLDETAIILNVKVFFGAVSYPLSIIKLFRNMIVLDNPIKTLFTNVELLERILFC